MNMFIPARIIGLIERNGLTKKEFCAQIGISQTTLSNIVNLKNDVGVSKLVLIAKYFNVGVEYFFSREESSITSEDAMKYNVKGIGRYDSDERIRELEEEIRRLNRENGRLEGKIEMLTERKSKAG